MVASLGCGEPSQELMGKLKSVLGHRKVLSHSMLKIPSDEMTSKSGPGRCEEVARSALT